MAEQLHAAIGSGKTELAEKLINEGADINELNQQGNSPLHLAVVNGNFRIAELLIKKGANIDIRDSEGRTPLDIARRTRPYLITLFEKQVTAQPMKASITKRQIKMVLIFVILPMVLLFAYTFLVETPHHITPAEEAEEKASKFNGLLLTTPCVKLDDKPVSITLEWSSEEVSFVTPKTYTFTGARFTMPRMSISKSDFLHAEEYGDHVFISVPVQRREGYSPSFYSDSVYVSIPKKLIPDGFKKPLN